MALTNCYVTLEDVKTRLGGVALDGGDPQLERRITSACRAIDVHCDQFFYDSGSASARTFRPDNGYRLMVPPFSTTTGFVVKSDTGDDGTYATTWASTDYELDYFGDDSTNAYDTVLAVGSYVFPTYNRRVRSVQVTAQWGWASVPQNVIEAAEILSADLWKRKDLSAGGISTATVEFGGIRISGDVLRSVSGLLQTFVRTDRKIGIA